MKYCLSFSIPTAKFLKGRLGNLFASFMYFLFFLLICTFMLFAYFFFLIFLFIYILFYFSRVLAVTDVLITISIGFWVHFCNHIIFYLFVLPGMLLLAHVFSFLALRMFLSNSKIFFQSSLPFSVFDVILFISFPLVQCMINQFYINHEITKISC